MLTRRNFLKWLGIGSSAVVVGAAVVSMPTMQTTEALGVGSITVSDTSGYIGYSSDGDKTWTTVRKPTVQ